MIVGLILGIGERFDVVPTTELVEAKPSASDPDVFRVVW